MLVGVMLGSFIGMMPSMCGVTVRSMGVMCTLLWRARLVMLCSFAMVVRRMCVMLGGLLMMFGAFVGHDVPPLGRENRKRTRIAAVPVASGGRGGVVTLNEIWPILMLV